MLQSSWNMLHLWAGRALKNTIMMKIANNLLWNLFKLLLGQWYVSGQTIINRSINSFHYQLDLEPSPKSRQYYQTSDSLKVCCCTSGCISKRCSCIREQRKCQDCSCVSCDNPLNILEEFGVNLAEAGNDSCLMQNLPKVNCTYTQ